MGARKQPSTQLVRLDKDILERIRKIAAKEDRTLKAQIERMIRFAMEAK